MTRKFTDEEQTRVRNWRKANPAKYLVSEYKRSATRRGLTWELTPARAWWLATQNCAYCGVPNAGGIDRAKNEYGYTVLNAVPCCSSCNYSKRTTTITEFLDKCAAVTKHCGTYEQFHTAWLVTRTSGPDFETGGRT